MPAAFKRVRGAQAEQAEELGWTKITERSARLLWEMDIPFLVAGNKVAPYHFEAGWRLAHHVEPERWKQEVITNTFDSMLNNFMFYLEPELGNRPAFFMRSRHVSQLLARGVE